jgi:hypothetical protein
LDNCIDATDPGGRIVQVGIMPAGNAGAPINKLLMKELELFGTFRFHETEKLGDESERPKEPLKSRKSPRSLVPSEPTGLKQQLLRAES